MGGGSARSKPAFLSAAVGLGFDEGPDCATYEEHADTLRPVDLVSAQRQEICADNGDVNGETCGTLAGVDV